MNLADTMPRAEAQTALMDTTDANAVDDRRGNKSDSAYRTISEVASELDLPQHVLRFWESKFKQISPLKRGGGRRYYRPQDVDLIKRIHYLLHTQGYTIKGVQKLLSKDRLLQNTVPILGQDSSARIELDHVIQRPAISTGDDAHASRTAHAASQSVTVNAMPQTTRTDLQLVINRLKNLRAQIAKTI